MAVSRAPEHSPEASAASCEAKARSDLRHIGSVIRRARGGRFTVEQLAQRSGVSAGLISQVERGLGNPSLVNLTKLAHALEVPMGAFFHGHTTSRMLVRRDRRRRLVVPDSGLTHELLVPDLDRKLAMVRTIVPPGFDNQEQPFVHPGDECVHVLAGRLEMVVDDERYDLDPGDSLTFDSGLPHWMCNPGEEAAEFIAVSSPPSM